MSSTKINSSILILIYLHLVFSFNQFESQSQIIGYSIEDENGRREFRPKVMVASVKQVFPSLPRKETNTINYSHEKSLNELRQNSPEIPPQFQPKEEKQNDQKSSENGVSRLEDGGINRIQNWRIVDNFALSSIVSANENFGYILHKPHYKQYRYEQLSEDGYITGEYGILPHGGAFKGVQYTADPSVDPAFIYLTLKKFTSF